MHDNKIKRRYISYDLCEERQIAPKCVILLLNCKDPRELFLFSSQFSAKMPINDKSQYFSSNILRMYYVIF